MAFRKLSDTPNDSGLAIDIETNRLARWDGKQFVIIADPSNIPLPEPPKEDGKYVLTVTVDEGEVAYEWEAQEPPESGGED